ncbi:MAG: PaREP1 family protein [Pyrobaculum sp.]|uniref:PaREP1 family protein n=1 Tax=Pyrobaculum sp. TaxID=2004705 RepID=UPI003EEFFC3B
MEVLEKPLPKPTAEEYAAARLLEALVEARLALEFLQRGLVRNAAGKAFQAWRALLAALLRLELDKLLQAAKTEDEKRWLAERAVPRVPTTRVVRLSQMLEEAGHQGIQFVTSMALDLHDYQYSGPDPDMALSKFRTREEAAAAVVGLVREVARRADSLRQRVKWTTELEEALGALREGLRGGWAHAALA